MSLFALSMLRVPERVKEKEKESKRKEPLLKIKLM